MRNIHTTVAAIAERDGTYLCVEEEIGNRLVLNQPAGHLELNETLIEAVQRETWEETAWRFTPTALLGVYHYTSDSGICYIRFAFIGQATDHDPHQPLDQGIRRAIWLDWPEICQRHHQHRGPQVAKALEDYRRGQCYPLDLVRSIP